MPKKDPARETRIMDEIIVDANGPEEQAMGWYYYLADTVQFPFTAQCGVERAISPLRKGDQVEIVGMAAEAECGHEMFVETQWQRRKLAIPLAQIKPIAGTDAATQQAVEDWHYWVDQGYEF
ncbi:MAG: calcium-binding protein [Anaerolineae bacterium]